MTFVGTTDIGKNIVYKKCGETGKRAIVQGAAKNFLVVMPDANIECEKKLSYSKIAKECDVSFGTIRNWLKNFSIPTRSIQEASDLIYDGGFYRDRDWLYQKYIIEELSVDKVAKLAGVSRVCIQSWMSRLHISSRSSSVANHLRQANHCAFTENLKQFLNGEMLGDGSIYANSVYSAGFRYGSKHKEYITFISATLLGYGIEQAGRITERQFG